MLSVNTKAPLFTLPDQNNISRSLTDFKGKWVVLYFYPKDMTPGCTKEACSFRDESRKLEDSVQIIGISTDGVASHKKFAEKYDLRFLLLADSSKAVVNAYEAYGAKKFMGKVYEGTYRITYLIDPDGMIVKTYPKVNPLTHAKEILEDLHA